MADQEKNDITNHVYPKPQEVLLVNGEPVRLLRLL